MSRTRWRDSLIPVRIRSPDMQRSGNQVLQFSKRCLPTSTKRHPLKIQSVATSSRPLPPLIALSEGRIPERLLRRLEKLDHEQLQIIEIVAVAIARGAM